MVSGQQAHRLRQRGMAGPGALGRPGGAQEGTRVLEDDRARLDARADLALRSLPRRPSAAPVLDLHRRRRTDRDHAHVGLLAVAAAISTPRTSTSRPMASRSRSRPTWTAAASTATSTSFCCPPAAANRRATSRPATRPATATALQPRRPPPGVRAAAHAEVLRRPRAPDDLRPQGRHHDRTHRRTGTGRSTAWSGNAIHAACWAPSTTPARGACTASG